EDQLAFAIRVHRPSIVVLGNGNDFWRAIDRGRRRENKFPDSMLAQDFKHRDSGSYIGGKEHSRINDGFRNERLRREMKYSVEILASQQISDSVAVAIVELMQPDSLWNRLSISCR